MNIVSSQQDQIEMVLKQMGAQVTSIHGLLCYVKIEIGGNTVSYVYNINAKDQYFLQRIMPYPLGAGVFSTQKEVLAYIKQDIKQFKNAVKSSVFQKYVDVNYKTHITSHELENVFFNYNVPLEKMDTINQLLDQIQVVMKDIKETCPKIELKK